MIWPLMHKIALCWADKEKNGAQWGLTGTMGFNGHNGV